MYRIRDGFFLADALARVINDHEPESILDDYAASRKAVAESEQKIEVSAKIPGNLEELTFKQR